MPSVKKIKPDPIPVSTQAVGSRLAQLRKSRGLSQVAFGELVGLTQKQVTDYETGKIHLNDETIIRIALNLGVSSDELLGLKDLEPLADSLSLRFTRRIKELDQLPEAKKKVILQVLDDLIRANS